MTTPSGRSLIEVDVEPLVLRLSTATSNRGSCAASAAVVTSQVAARRARSVMPVLDEARALDVRGGPKDERGSDKRCGGSTMLRTAIPLCLVMALLTTACGSTPADDPPAPAISTAAADNLI